MVSTAKFWFSLYRRYYTTAAFLPERLQPECLFRKYGIRAAVIRALNFMYKPFITRISSLEKQEQHPDILERSKCVLMWRKHKKQQYFYYFKMRTNVTNHRIRENTNTKPDLLEMLDDAFANHEEGCRILQVTCRRLIPLPPVLGLTLCAANLNLSSELRSYRLQLLFGSEIRGLGGSTVVVLEPVINVKVLDWWHPLYPHNHNMEHLFNRE